MKRHDSFGEGTNPFDEVSLSERLDQPVGMLVWLVIAPLFWLAALLLFLIAP